jgi:hypothetical protein
LKYFASTTVHPVRFAVQEQSYFLVGAKIAEQEGGRE